MLKKYQNDKPYTYDEMLAIEKVIYNESLIKETDVASNVSIKEILKRNICIFNDKEYNMPQNIFIINNYKGKKIIGRKIWSVLSIENKINAINCSMITSSMLLGILKDHKKVGQDIMIEYYPFSKGEKITVFDEIKKNLSSDIYYPFKYKDYVTKKEEISPLTGWSFNPNKKEYLGYGEHHIREYTKRYFKNYDSENKVIYDPACSTGEFLHTFQNNYQKCITVGHDLSQEMIDYAKDYVDEALCCNAINSPLKENSVDVMFLRFLNSEVVSTRMAYKIIKRLLFKVKKDGLVICFGHTPVLIKKEWFIKNGLEVINSIGYDQTNDAIFQYYVLKK